MTGNPLLLKARKLTPLLVIAAGLLAYHNSFRGAFVQDDFTSIPDNPTIRHLWPIWQCLSRPHRGDLTVESRPFINLSLAINYALGGLQVWGYHALNLTVHILAGLTLFGIVRRTLLQPALRTRFGTAANELALATAVLWTVHPLQTESVTYIIQRAESMMGLFYLLTLYCFIRGVESHRAHLWYTMSVMVCALGMASKEVMITAPVMVLLYDRVFLSGTFREAWRRRLPLYLGLSATWILLGSLLIRTVNNASINAGRIGLTWWQYLATEPGVLLYYLRLCVWPSPLCMNRPWPIARTWISILPPTIVLVVLLAALAWAWRRNSGQFRTGPVWGFVAAWFFLILAPSSSFVPSLDSMYEHRLYLSLAAVVSLLVMGLYSIMGRQSLGVCLVLAIGLGFLTARRNQDYRSEVALWSDAVVKFPNDPAAHYKLGVAMARAGRVQEAIDQYQQAGRLNPHTADEHWNLGNALRNVGMVTEAMDQYEQAVRLKPDFAEAYNNWGVALAQAGRLQEAIEHYEQALRIEPQNARAHFNLGVAWQQLGKGKEAIDQYQQAVQIDSDFAQAHENLGVALFEAGRLEEASIEYRQALRINPDDADAHNNLGASLLRLGRIEEAIEHFEQALHITPEMVEAHYNLGVVLEQTGKTNVAIEQYEQVVRLKPDYAEAQQRLTKLRTAR
jgi:protein O-mannosyl-transferase